MIEALSMGTRTAMPFSLPLSSGKMVAMAVADPVEVGARLSMPERQRLKSWRGKKCIRLGFALGSDVMY